MYSAWSLPRVCGPHSAAPTAQQNSASAASLSLQAFSLSKLPTLDSVSFSIQPAVFPPSPSLCWKLSLPTLCPSMGKWPLTLQVSTKRPLSQKCSVWFPDQLRFKYMLWMQVKCFYTALLWFIIKFMLWFIWQSVCLSQNKLHEHSVCVCVYVYTHTYMYVCMYVYMYVEISGPAQVLTNTQQHIK